MKITDISLPLQEGMVVWPGDTRFKRGEYRGTAIVSKITMSSHAGTHLDAPKHFLLNNLGIDKVVLTKLIGKAKVVAVKSRRMIEPQDFAHVKITGGSKILFKTRNGRLLGKKRFDPDYVSLSLPAAKYLAAKKIDLVGIDYYGIEAKSSPGHPVHKTLLRAGIVIVEGLDLSRVKPGNYFMAALPPRLVGADGSPCRAVLWPVK